MIYKEDFEFNLFTDEELDQLIELVKNEKQERENLKAEEIYDKMQKIYNEIINAGFTLYYDYDAIDMSDLYLKKE